MSENSEINLPEAETESKPHKVINLQDTFLNIARKEHIPLTVFLTNGFQMRGQVRGFDNYVLMLDVEGKSNMIYKHAISTMIPARQVEMLSDNK